MEQNNFEKNIQQKLDELKIHPSGSVWQNVEKRIAKKDQHRWKVFILIFLFLITLSGGYWLLNSEKNNKQLSQKSANTFQNNIAESRRNKNNSSLHKSLPDEKSDITKIATSDITTVKNENSHKQKSRKTIFIKKEFLKTETHNEITSQDETTNKNHSNEESVNLKNVQNGLSHKNINKNKEIDLAKNVNEKISTTEIEKSAQEKIGQDNVLPLTQAENNSEKKDFNLVVNSKKTTKIKSFKKWNFAITFSGGESLVGNNLLGINNNSNAFLTSASPSGGGSGGTQTYYSPSETRNSFAFIAGVFFEKNILVKNKISIGINYKYFSTINKTGSRIDSVQTAYNLSNGINNVKNYRNNFNYLELPVSIKFQLGNNKSLPIFWNAGINISQLISSNALQFKNNSGVYYIDNSLFNKTQIGISTGFSVMLFSKENHPISIGPYFYYNASKLANDGLYNKKHFSFMGISTEILFPKK